MRVCVNGRETEIAAGLTMESMIAEKGLNPGAVVVELNSEIVSREKWTERVLSEGDTLEVIAFVGGG